MSGCGITGEGYAALAAALKSNPSHLEELDLRGNDPGHSEVKLLTDLLQDPACKLQRLSQEYFHDVIVINESITNKSVFFFKSKIRFQHNIMIVKELMISNKSMVIGN